MGAYLIWAWLPLVTERKVPDHSHAIWLAARATPFRRGDEGAVEILSTPMLEIVRFAARSQGQPVRVLQPEAAVGRSVYSDLRSLIKFNGILAGGIRSWADEVTASAVFETVSPVIGGNRIVRLVPHASTETFPSEEPPWKVFRRAFAGSDFHLREATRFTPPDGRLDLSIGSGRSAVFLARAPFSLVLSDAFGKSREVASVPDSPDAGWQVLALTGRDLQSGTARLRANADVPPGLEIAEAVLPDYMSARSFGH
jgi:hypothetical protein